MALLRYETATHRQPALAKFTLMVRLISIVVLLGVIAGCGINGREPSSQIVQRGLVKLNELVARQISQTPQPSFSTRLQSPSFRVDRVAIDQQQSLTIQDLPGYRVKGTYNLKIALPKRRVTQQQNPFDIYLQRQKEGKTWRLAIPHAGSWLTYSL